jgi:protein-S-isoprenylcysteine O-methyltransferase Ste14
LSGLDRNSLPLSTGWSFAIGLTCLVPGIAMIAAGRLTFGNRARVYGLKEDQLLTHGIYRWSRNPQYFGTFLVLISAAVFGT